MRNWRKWGRWLGLGAFTGVLCFGGLLAGLNLRLRLALLEPLKLPLTLEHLLWAPHLMEQAEVKITADKPSLQFAPGLAYEEMLADGVIKVVIYREPLLDTIDWTKEIALIQKRAEKSQVEFRYVESAEALRQAFKEGEFVIFSGHANLGQGLNLWSLQSQTNQLWQISGAQLQDPLPEKYRFPPESTDMRPLPSLEAPVFFYLSCRSATYYGKTLQDQFPNTNFMFANYEWAPGNALLLAVDLLCQSLEQRQSLTQLQAQWERLYRGELLMGRSRQLKKHPEDLNFPDQLFRWVPSEA